MEDNYRNSYGKRNFKKYGFDLNPVVSGFSGFIVLTFIVFALILPEQTTEFFTNMKNIMVTKFNWLYTLTINLVLGFMIWLVFSKYGKLRLGGKAAEKEFSNISWYAMLFSAGIGIGIFFYGIAEPIMHLNVPNELQSGLSTNPFRIMYLHWGIHAWSVYAMIAIALGYMAYNKGLPFSMRTILYPIIKEKIYGFWGDLVDVIAVVSVLFGLAASLGLGAGQINAGLNFVFGIPLSGMTQVVLIALITSIATVSVATGLKKGIKILSELNVYISLGFLTLIFIVGPTVFILSTYISGLGEYIKDFIPLGMFIGTSEEAISWQGGWTIFYWAWWISWSPFVGMFIARISKGRSLREIVLGVILIPSLVIFFAMTILGATGVYLNEMNQGAISAAVNNNLATSMYSMIDLLFNSTIMKNVVSVIAMIAVTIFFVTSSDSGSLVVDNLTSGGKLTSPRGQRVFWAIMEGLIAISVLLLGGLSAFGIIQSAVIASTLPFALLLIVAIYSMIKMFKKEDA